MLEKNNRKISVIFSTFANWFPRVFLDVRNKVNTARAYTQISYIEMFSTTAK